MISRRAVIRAGMATAVLSNLSISASASDLARLKKLPSFESVLLEHQPEVFIYDQRFTSPATLGLAVSNLTAFPVEDDLTELWLDTLSKVWSDQPLIVAGVTTGNVLFMMERLGWDNGLRLVSRESYSETGKHGLDNREDGLVAWLLAPREQIIK